MTAMGTFQVGDRVRVVDDYFVAHLRGATGTITAPTESIRDHIRDGCFWVEFDQLQPDENGALTDAAEIDGMELRSCQCTFASSVSRSPLRA
jgi:hypothetical protein